MKKFPRKFLTPKEAHLFDRLNTPQKLQDFLNKLPQNFEEKGETCLSPRRVLQENKAHCIEGALFAAAILWYHGRRPMVMHLITKNHDYDHVVAIFKDGNCYGALSKTNHAVLRYRDPVYKTPRELALSYFNEYFMDGTGEKTMLGFTKPIDLEKIAGTKWLSDEKNLWDINDKLFHTRHQPVAPKSIMKKLRPADAIEIRIMDVPEQKRPMTNDLRRKNK